MPQTDYNDQSAIPAVKGGLADTAYHDIVGANADADINFGLGLALTATEGKVAVPSATGFKFAGVALQTQKDTPRDTGVAVHEADSEFPMLRKGRVWVYSEEAVDPTKNVYLRFTTNGALVPGDFRTEPDNDGTNDRADLVAGARWVSTTTAAGLAMLEINVP